MLRFRVNSIDKNMISSFIARLLIIAGQSPEVHWRF